MEAEAKAARFLKRMEYVSWAVFAVGLIWYGLELYSALTS